MLVPDVHLLVGTDPGRVQLLPDAEAGQNIAGTRADRQYAKVVRRIVGNRPGVRLDRLDQRDPEAVLRQRVSRTGADHAGADDDNIETLRVHRCPRSSRLPPKVMPMPASATCVFSAGSKSSRPSPAARAESISGRSFENSVTRPSP